VSGFLAAVVGAQVALLLGLSLALIAHRWVAAAGQEGKERERARLGEALRGFLTARLTAAEFLRVLDGVRPDSVAAVIQRHGAQINGEAWESVVEQVRRSRWFGTELGRRLRSRFWWRRLVGARMLAVLGGEKDLSVVRRLVSDKHPAVKVAAIAVLRRVCTPELLASVLDEAIAAPSVVRHYFFDTLLTVGPALVPTLRQRLGMPRDDHEIPALLRLAGEVGAPELLVAILPHARHPDMETRAAAARALGAYPHAQACDALVGLLSDHHWQVRARAASALGSIRALDARDVLTAALRDANWWVRLRAAVALRQLGPAGVSLLKTAERSGDRFAAEMARYTLGLTDAAVADYVA